MSECPWYHASRCQAESAKCVNLFDHSCEHDTPTPAPEPGVEAILDLQGSEYVTLDRKDVATLRTALEAKDGRTPLSPPPWFEWEVIDKTTPSGKQLFRCSSCGTESPTPDKWEYHADVCYAEIYRQLTLVSEQRDRLREAAGKLAYADRTPSRYRGFQVLGIFVVVVLAIIGLITVVHLATRGM